jgi:hypothetical protein
MEKAYFGFGKRGYMFESHGYWNVTVPPLKKGLYDEHSKHTTSCSTKY